MEKKNITKEEEKQLTHSKADNNHVERAKQRSTKQFIQEVLHVNCYSLLHG